MLRCGQELLLDAPGHQVEFWRQNCSILEVQQLLMATATEIQCLLRAVFVLTGSPNLPSSQICQKHRGVRQGLW